MISSVLVILLAEWKLLPILIIDMRPFSLAVDDLKLLVAGERTFWRRHCDKPRGRTGRDRRGQKSIGNYLELCRPAIEGDAGGPSKALAKDVNRGAETAGSGEKADEGVKTGIEAIEHSNCGAAAAAGLSI